MFNSIVTGVNAPFAKQTLGRKLFGATELSYDEKLGHNKTSAIIIIGTFSKKSSENQ